MSCRRVVELISLELDTDLPLHQRAGLGFHTLVCGACRRFKRQIGAVDEAVDKFIATAVARVADSVLSPPAKEHLKAVIINHLDGES